MEEETIEKKLSGKWNWIRFALPSLSLLLTAHGSNENLILCVMFYNPRSSFTKKEFLSFFCSLSTFSCVFYAS